jgi:hypothetical protein
MIINRPALRMWPQLCEIIQLCIQRLRKPMVSSYPCTHESACNFWTNQHTVWTSCHQMVLIFVLWNILPPVTWTWQLHQLPTSDLRFELYLYICTVLLWLIPHPIVIWLTYGSMECNIYVYVYVCVCVCVRARAVCAFAYVCMCVRARARVCEWWNTEIVIL